MYVDVTLFWSANLKEDENIEMQILKLLLTYRI